MELGTAITAGINPYHFVEQIGQSLVYSIDCCTKPVHLNLALAA